MKKSMLVTLVIAILVFMASSHGLAQVTGVADTNKEGSLLIWPFVQVTYPYDGNDGNETYIFITNRNPNDAEDVGVDVKCYWEIKSDPTNLKSECYVTDFAFYLSNNNPIIFKASTGAGLDNRSVAAGMGEGVGALKCWAVDPTQTKQISWDHLSGSAMILDSNETPETIGYGQTTVFQYNAYRLAGNVLYKDDNSSADGFQMGHVTTTYDIDDPNKLKLTGLTASEKPKFINLPHDSCVTPYDQVQCRQYTAPDVGCGDNTAPAKCWKYDACPKYLTFDFLSEYNYNDESGYALNYLALVPCKEDLSDSEFNLKTSVTFTIWNENEVKYTGTYQLDNCYYNVALADVLSPSKINMFQASNLHTATGRFRVEGKTNKTKYAGSVNTPLLGVLAAQIVSGEMASVDRFATTGTGGGSQTDDDLAGFIKWVPTGLPEKGKR